MSVQAQLDYESRVKRRNAAIAALAGLLLVLAVVLGLSGPQTKIDELTLSLITEHKRGGYDIVGAVVDGMGYLALAWTLVFLYQTSRARRPEIPSYVRWLVIIGAVLAVTGGIVYHIIFLHDANNFVTPGSAETYMQANHLTTSGTFFAVGILINLGGLLLTAGFVWTSLNAMRVGLLPRMLGYAGIVSGIFVLFPIGFIAPFIQAGWLVALAYLFTGRWSSGVPAAWSTGEAVPWPSSADARAARAEAAGRGRPARPERARPDKARAEKASSAKGSRALKPAVFQDDEKDTTVVPAQPAAPKRKRKRRR